MEHQSCEIPLLFYKGCFAVTSGVTLVIVLGSSPGFEPNISFNFGVVKTQFEQTSLFWMV